MKKSLCVALSVLLGVGLCLGAFSLSANALTDPDYLVPVYTGSASAVTTSDGLVLGVMGGKTYVAYVGNTSAGVTVGAHYPGYFLFLSTSQPSGYYLNVRAVGGGGSDYNAYNTITVDGVTYYSLQRVDTSFTVIDCESFSDYNSCLSALISALDYNPAPDPDIPVIPGYGDGPFKFTLPAGYAALINPSGSNGSVQLDTLFREPSTIIPLSGTNPVIWWPGATASYAFIDYVALQDEFYIGDTSGSLVIPWQRINQFAPFRQSINGQITLSWNINTDNECCLIVNPYYNTYESQYNNSISVTVSNPREITLYNLSSSYDTIGNVPVIKSSVTSRFVLGGDGVYYPIDANGYPTESGSSVTLPGTSEYDSADAQTSVLDNIVSSIEQFFGGTWLHIKNLSESLGSFPSFMKSIYSFLPNEITSIVLSLFGILCTLGVVKALL